MPFRKFDNPYHAAIDRVSRILSPGTIHRVLMDGYCNFQKLPPDVFVAACIIVCLHRISKNPLALFTFGNYDQSRN